MGLEIGIVGLPNVGKSMLFQALTRTKTETANYRFSTIEPNVGIVPVKDPRVQILIEKYKPKKIVYSTLRIVDIAGLAKGASKGEGLGNQFLSHIREMDALVHVVRCFEDDNVIHEEGPIDPINDIETIQMELVLADLDQLERKLDRIKKQAKGNRELVSTIPVYEKMRDHLDKGLLAQKLPLNDQEKDILKDLNLLTMKPYIYLANISEEGLTEPLEAEKLLSSRAMQEDVDMVTVCAKIEAELAEMEEEEADLFMTEIGIEQSGLVRLTQVCYGLLSQITFFTAGEKEVHAWNTAENSTAPKAAGKIHSDFERGFIRAEVFHFDDLCKFGSEASLKEAGRWRLEGKEYIVKDGDILNIRFNI